jgi:nucleoside-diphosphate-sugar epimerase
MPDHFLVTGALGCVGAWTVRALVDEGAQVVAYDLGSDPHRLRLIMTPDELKRVTFLSGDITDLAALERALDQHEVTHVVHLAALQVPFCREDPVRGAHVNVVGTTSVFEAVKRRRDRIRGVAYASSVAIYGPKDKGAENPRPLPSTHYGVFKQANEGTARIYWQDEGVPSIGLRPYTIYGPGRDQGVTSGPTRAMQAAVRGEAFHISFGGRSHFHYVADVARIFITASRALRADAGIFNIPSKPELMSEMVEAIVAAAPEARGKISYDDLELPFAVDLEAAGLERAVGPVELTPLAEGVRETVALFRKANDVAAT